MPPVTIPTPVDYIFNCVRWYGQYTTQQIADAYDPNNLQETTTKLAAFQQGYGVVPDFYTDAKNAKRAHKKWRFIRNYMAGYTMTNMLDFGGGKGDIAFHLGEIMHIPKAKRFYMDIDNWSGQDWESGRRKDIPYIPVDKLGEIPSNSIDFILLSHVLHHIPDADITQYIEQFRRILSSNGVIVLYEHDCVSKEFGHLLDLQHMMYDVVLSQTLTYDKFLESHYANYKSAATWYKLFKTFNSCNKIDTKSTDRSFYGLFWQ